MLLLRPELFEFFSRLTDFTPNSTPFVPLPSTLLFAGTDIDHIHFTSSSMTFFRYDTGNTGLWLEMIDHSPALASITDLPNSALRSRRFTHTYSQARKFLPSLE